MLGKLQTLLYFLVALMIAPLVGCGDDDNEGPMNPGTSSKTFRVTITNTSGDFAFPVSGSFSVPVGATEAGAIGPGQAYEFRVGATPGQALSFATMMVQSNDLFFAPDGDGIALFDGSDNPISGNVTDQVELWDAGTEEDEEPGLGGTQAPRQDPAGNDGPNDPDNTVRLANGPFTYPAVSDMIEVTITHEGGNTFLVRIENVSVEGTLVTTTNEMLAVPMAPGIFVVHSDPNPYFTAGSPDAGDGLEALAEDGNASGLAAYLGTMTGVGTPFAPGVWAVHTTDGPFFDDNVAYRSNGIEALAEDGDPAGLATAVMSRAGIEASGVFNTPTGAAGPGALMPGATYAFEFDASDGDRLSLATMFVQSNDLFVAPNDMGVDLYPGGAALSGDITSMFDLWDAGTEANQWPGAGPDPAPRQDPAGNDGPDDP
ncbi:MAG: hypothetical protein HKN20_16635, partial [Gemmatimonadetes bacterium]|nr:hypothetical protein [Gemmatimonadota bacterium]